MSIFGRLSRIVKGKANSAVDAAEEATFETTLKQTIRDMKGDLNKVIRASADAMSNSNRLEAQYNKHVAQAEDWKKKAQKALGAGNEDLARKALAKKAESDAQATSLQGSVEQGTAARDKLKSQVEQLKRKIDDAERKSSTLIARKNAATAQKKMAQVVSGINDGDNAFASLSRFEESVDKEEAAAKAYEDMSTNGDSDLEAEFAALDTSSTDDELAKMKAEMAQAK